MKKKVTLLLVLAMIMAVIPMRSQNARALKKMPEKAQTSLVKPKTQKGAHAKMTSDELKVAMQNGDKLKAAKRVGSKQMASVQKELRKMQDRPKVQPVHRVQKSTEEQTPVTVPYEAVFSSDEPMNDFIVINNNDDLSDGEPCTWKWSSGNGAYYVYNEDGVTGADDYLVLPITLQGGKKYEVTVNAAVWNYPEEFEVVAGSEPTAAALTTTIIGKTTPENEPADYTGFFTPETDGVYYIAIHATSPADQYILSIYRFAIDEAPDPSAPLAATGLTVEQVTGELKTTVTFTAPTQSIGGDELTGNVTIGILRDGELVKTLENVAPGSEQVFTDEVPAEGNYSYRLTASNAAGKGRTTAAVTVKVKMPANVPYVADFSDSDAFDNFSVIDNNADGSTWEYNPVSGLAQYHYDTDNAGDDYLVSQPLNLKAGSKYVVTVNAASYFESNTERFEVVAGMSANAEGLNISVIEPTEVTSTSFGEYTGTFTAQETGIYYVAIHATSAPDQFYLQVSKFSVEAGAAPTAPAAPTLTVTPAAKGEKKATVEVTAPATTVEGNALASISKVEIWRDDALLTEQTGVAPGASFNFIDENIETSGLYNYYAVAYNETGRGEKSDKVAVYVGIDEPGAPSDVVAVDNGTTIDFSWNAVGETGVHGGYVDPANVTYNIHKLIVSPYYVFFDDEKLASVTGETKATVEFNTDEGNEQEYTYFAVRATNESTVNEDNAEWGYSYLFTGKPYDMPLTEGFADGEFHYYWESNGLLMIANSSADDDGNALALLAKKSGLVPFISGKLNLKDTNDPQLVFSALGGNISKLYILGDVDGKQSWNIIQTLDLSDEGYTTYQVSLASLKNNSRYAQIAFAAQFNNASTLTEDGYIEKVGDYIYIDNIRIGDFWDNDLTLSVVAPQNITFGQTADIIVTVENAGTKAASDYSVKVVANGQELLNTTAAEALAPFAKTQYVAQLSTSVFDEPGDVAVTVTIDYAADQYLENNTVSGVIELTEPTAASPENLTAENKGDNGIYMSWSAPETQPEAVVEDFEATPGEFTQIDADNDGNGWFYYNNYEMKSHSGTGALQSYSYVPNVGAVHVDNWLVTPLAVLEDGFSFWAAAQDADWTDEHFAVYVSTKGNESVDDFTMVSEEFTATSQPTEYTADLSSYAGQTGYIAIRHYNSYDQFALVVDDISFTKAPATPVKYNIYFESTLVATVDASQTTFTVPVSQITSGNHTVAVTAVYPNGTESRPVKYNVSVTTGISEITRLGDNSEMTGDTWYDVQGRRIGSKPSQKGIYINNGIKVVIK